MPFLTKNRYHASRICNFVRKMASKVSVLDILKKNYPKITIDDGGSKKLASLMPIPDKILN